MSTRARFELACKADDSTFIFELTDPTKIAFARRIVDGSETRKVSVMGTIVKSRAAYNPKWSYHLEPGSIDFFENAVEVCDATPSFVEKNLRDVGGAVLPGNHWCPWCSRVVREVLI